MRFCLNRPGTLHDFRSHEIADQLTLLDAELFYKIEVSCSFVFQLIIGQTNYLLVLFSFRFLKCYFGPRSRMRRRVRTWLSSQSTLTTWATGETNTRHLLASWLSVCVWTYWLYNCLVHRVRSLIIQQEKAQDREKLLLKFIKIMKVPWHIYYSILNKLYMCFHLLVF